MRDPPQASIAEPTPRSSFARLAGWAPKTDRELRLFTAFLLWSVPTVTVIAVSYFDALSPDNINMWRLTLGAPAALIAIAHLLVLPRLKQRVQNRLLVISATCGVLINGPLLAITPALWAIEMNLLAATVWAGYVLRGLGGVWIVGVTSTVALSPLVVDYPGVSSQDASRLVVYVPVIWVVAAALRFQKRNVTTALALVHELAFHDPLTSLANRNALADAFARYSKDGQGLSLLLIDLDNFKSANTAYGHVGGDHALATVAYYLKRAAAREHVVARIGGDEFVVLLPGAVGDAGREMATLYRGVVLAANQEMMLPGVEIDASVGVAEYPLHGLELEDLLSEADRTMYVEKAKHGLAKSDADHVAERPAEAEIELEATGKFKPITPFQRFWRRRPLYARFSVVLTTSTATLMVVSSFVPNAPVEDRRATVAVCLVAIVASVALFLIGTRHRGPLHRIADTAGLLGLVVLIYLTGGASSPALPLVILFAAYQAWFWSVRSVGWRILGPLLVLGSPVFYDPTFTVTGWEVPASTLYTASAMTLMIIVALTINITVLLGIRRRSRELAHTDPLTRLPNRRAFAERVQQELESVPAAAERQLAVVMIDLDNFKEINTQLGHRGGDDLLQEIGAALAVAARSTDFVARVGGDEFAAVLPDAGVDGARRLAERFVAAVAIASRPVALETGVHVTASAGFSLHPLHGKTLDELMAAADDALMSVKRDGKAGTRVSNVVIGI